jgi:exonuclease SbcC
LKYKESCLAEIQKIETTLTIGQTEIKTLLEQLTLIDFELYRTKLSTEIELECNAFLEKYERIFKQYSELSVKISDLKKNKDILSGSMDANQGELKAELVFNESLTTQLADRMKENGYAQLTDVEQVLNQQIDLEQEKKRLSAFRQQLALAQNQTGQLQQELGDRSYDSENHLKISQEAESVKSMLNQKNQELGKIAELLQKLKRDLENQAVLRKQHEDLELRAENIRTLKSLFKGSGFVNWVSSVYLQNLCHAANDRFFQLTRQKLSLEITEDNNFQVRDFMNGGKVRSTKTLSGGQTFQAALSLALALADNIQKITESNQNFFFLDEGFGSLDKEALSDVFETLKALRKENRIVGVISHVEEMQQEIEVHLKIENLEERGSIIRQSWTCSD